jgi:hypothetical protein
METPLFVETHICVSRVQIEHANLTIHTAATNPLCIAGDAKYCVSTLKQNIKST